MNIFENYLIKIKDLVERNSGSLNIKLPENFRGVTVETPPENFDFDLSCNIALVLGKKHKVNPIKLAENVRIVLKKEIKDFELIDIANPGFLNLKLNCGNTWSTNTSSPLYVSSIEDVLFFSIN